MNVIIDFVLLRFWARASEDLSAIEVILLLLFPIPEKYFSAIMINFFN